METKDHRDSAYINSRGASPEDSQPVEERVFLISLESCCVTLEAYQDRRILPQELRTTQDIQLLSAIAPYNNALWSFRISDLSAGLSALKLCEPSCTSGLRLQPRDNHKNIGLSTLYLLSNDSPHRRRPHRIVTLCLCLNHCEFAERC